MKTDRSGLYKGVGRDGRAVLTFWLRGHGGSFGVTHYADTFAALPANRLLGTV